MPAYGDPRVTRSAVWSAVEPELVAVMRRWLSREDMQMFCDVISATQDHHHWPPRREFWLKKFRRGEIDEAWVAFSPAALTYARRMLADRFRQSADRRFASQTYREGKSLLIMRIGNRIVVDGCNNYKTHIFMSSDPRAPKLYRWEYCCDQIRKSSSSSRMHHPIYSWASWVEQNT